MAYQVIALKWRPQTFEEIVGQEHVTRTLQNAIRLERVPHAFLFSGSRGVGKTTTARILAKALVCEQGPTEKPCGTCRFCGEVRDGRSLDVLEIDGASNRGIDEIRDLREKARYAPTAGRYKIYIIDEVHMLTTPAFNALLKTLEEPPPHVKFIFATTEITKVPITIQSRCQRFDFRLLNRGEIVAQLRKIIDDEGVTISDGALDIIAAAAEGSLRDSQSLLDQVLAFCGKEVREEDVHQALGLAEEKTTLAFIAALAARDGAAGYRLLDAQASAGCDLKAFVRDVLAGLRDLALMVSAPSLEGFASSTIEGVEALKKIAGSVSPGRAHGLFDIFLRAEADLRMTTFPRMTIELAILRAVRLEEVGELRELLERLESLEGRFGRGVVSAAPPAPARAEAGADRDPVPEPRAPRAEVTDPGEFPAEDSAGPEKEVEISAAPDPDGGQGLFERLIERVRRDGVVLASFLEHGRLRRAGEGEIEISFEAGNNLFIDTLKDSENHILLRRAAHDVMGRKVDVKLVLEDRTGQGEEKGAGESDLKKKYRREALEHPLIMNMVEVFQAQVVDVKVL